MKKILTIAIAFAAISFTANAQTQREKTGNSANRMERRNHDRHEAIKDLNLTADQQAKLKAQHQEAKAQMEAIKAQNLSEDQMKAKRMELRKAQMAKRQAILTAEQNAQLAKNRSAQVAEGNKRGYMKARGMQLNKELGLSNEQGQKMKELHQNTKQQMQAIKADQNLSQEARKAKLKELKKSTLQSRNQILTKEQQQKAMEIRKAHKENKGQKGNRGAKHAIK